MIRHLEETQAPQESPAVSTVMRAMASSLSRLPLPRTSVSAIRFSSIASSMGSHSSLRNFNAIASISTSSGVATEAQQQQSDTCLSSELIGRNSSQRWRPMCLYHTQGRCTMVRMLEFTDEVLGLCRSWRFG